MRTIIIITFFIVTITIISGCGVNYPAVNLTGTVTVDGTPVESGFLSITPAEGGRGTGVRTAITGGKYQAKNVPAGKCRVSFTAVKKTGNKTTGMKGEPVDEQVSIIPDKYSNGLEINVETGQATLDFPLTSM
ncbi:MAG: hypothetical protein LBH00_09530 [Planctomycetaceae bacterium]|nr:hypothetical protein [Planctomycetaceae bacterium]